MAREKLKGKAALLTGSAKRIGRQTALTLAGAGVNIVVHYNRSQNEAEKLCDELLTLGVGAWTVQGDFQVPEKYLAVIEEAQRKAGGLDILVNNASIFPSDTLESLTRESLIENIQVNAWAPFALCRAFGQRVKQGAIVNMHDSRLKGFDWTHVGYILSKHVLAEMTRMLALQLAPGIRVNAVSPGLILPPPGKDMSYIERLVDTVPLKRHGGPQDIADAILFLCESDFITGEVIYVDGGRHLWEYGHGSHPDQGPAGSMHAGRE